MNISCVCSPYPVVVVQLYITDSSAQNQQNITQPVQSGQWENNSAVKLNDAQKRHFWIRQIPSHLENTHYTQQVDNAGIQLKDDQESLLTHYWVQQISSRPWNVHYTQRVDSIMTGIQSGHLVVDKSRSERIMHTLVDAARKTIHQKVADGVMNSRVIDEMNQVIVDAKDLLYQRKTPQKSAVDFWV